MIHRKGESFKNRSHNQNRNPSAIFAEQFFLIRRTGSEPQTFFVCQIIKHGVFRRGQIGPMQPARR